MGSDSKDKRADKLDDRIRRIAERAAEERTSSLDRQLHERSLRTPKYRDATIVLISGETVRVVVKEISATGARIEFKSHVSLPDRIFLTEPTIPLNTWAYVVWQKPGVAGLEYVR